MKVITVFTGGFYHKSIDNWESILVPSMCTGAVAPSGTPLVRNTTVFGERALLF